MNKWGCCRASDHGEQSGFVDGARMQRLRIFEGISRAVRQQEALKVLSNPVVAPSRNTR
jgi:hypothetical protein